MGTLILVRHGQASFYADDYDQLSELGVTQARALGAYWADLKRHVDVIYAGPLRRQRDTARHLVDAAAERGHALPKPTEHPGLAEYPAFEILAHVLPDLLERDPVVREGYDDDGKPIPGPAYVRALQHVMTLWANDAIDVGPFETYRGFRLRVDTAISEILEAVGHGRTVVATTSGGPVAVAVQRALELESKTAIKVAWTVTNAATTEFLFRPDELSLSRFNVVAHLEGRGLVTDR